MVCEREALWKKIHKWGLGWLWLFFGVFFVLIYEMMLQPFELNSANVDLKHDAFTPIRSSETYSTYYLQQLASMKCKTLLVLEGKETPEPEI